MYKRANMLTCIYIDHTYINIYVIYHQYKRRSHNINMSRRGREEVVYLTSLGSLDIYPNNTPCAFTNNLTPPIYLDSSREYEVGLVSILYPKQFYTVLKGDSHFSISFISRIGEEEFEYIYTPNTNILAGDMSRIVEILNNEIYERLKLHLENYNIESIIKNKTLFCWNGNNVTIHCTKSRGKKTTTSYPLQFWYRRGIRV